MNIAHFVGRSLTKKQKKNNMKKGTKIRVLKDNSIGTITDSTFFKLNGQKHIRYEVSKKGVKEKRWYPEEELGPVVENCKVTLEGEHGQVLLTEIGYNHDRGEATITISGGNPRNLKEHRGYHLNTLAFMLSGMNTKVLDASVSTD